MTAGIDGPITSLEVFTCEGEAVSECDLTDRMYWLGLRHEGQTDHTPMQIQQVATAFPVSEQ